MSTLDDAFIKAYRKGQATMGNYAVEAGPQPAGSRAVAGAPHPTVPPPHARFASVSAAAAPARASSTETIDSSSSTRTALRPAYEVRQFMWPRLVGCLAEQAAAELHAAVDLLGARSHQGRRSLLITGCTRGEGRTTLLLTLAYVASQRGLRAALVDFDFRHPDLADQLGLARQVGAEEMYEHGLPVDEVLIESPSQGLTLLPLVRPLAEPGADEAPGGWSAALGELRRDFELVLIDSGPLDSDGAAIDLAALLGDAPIDDALIVHAPGISGDTLQLVGKRLAAARLRHWDLAENFVRITA